MGQGESKPKKNSDPVSGGGKTSGKVLKKISRLSSNKSRRKLKGRLLSYTGGPGKGIEIKLKGHDNPL